MSDNYLGPPAAFAVAQMISINSTLTHISLRGNFCYVNIILLYIWFVIKGNGFDDKASEPLAEIVKV